MKKIVWILLILNSLMWAKNECTKSSDALWKQLEKQYQQEILEYSGGEDAKYIETKACFNIDNKIYMVQLYSQSKSNRENSASLLIGIVNSQKQIVESYFHKDALIIDYWIIGISLDTKSYTKLSKYKPFGIILEEILDGPPTPSKKKLFIYENNLRPILTDLTIEEYDEEMAGHISARTTSLKSYETNLIYPLLSFSHNYSYASDGIKEKWKVKLDDINCFYKNGKYECKVKSIFDLKQVAKNTLDGLKYREIVLHAMLDEIPLNKENVETYHTISIRLKAHGHKKEGNFLAEQILGAFPERKSLAQVENLEEKELFRNEQIIIDEYSVKELNISFRLLENQADGGNNYSQSLQWKETIVPANIPLQIGSVYYKNKNEFYVENLYEYGFSIIQFKNDEIHFLDSDKYVVEGDENEFFKFIVDFKEDKPIFYFKSSTKKMPYDFTEYKPKANDGTKEARIYFDNFDRYGNIYGEQYLLEKEVQKIKKSNKSYQTSKYKIEIQEKKDNSWELNYINLITKEKSMLFESLNPITYEILENEILVVSTSCGSPCTNYLFKNLETGKEYSTQSLIAYNQKYIATIELNGIVEIRELFGEKIYATTLDIASVAVPTSAIEKATFKGNYLEVEYLSGEEYVSKYKKIYFLENVFQKSKENYWNGTFKYNGYDMATGSVFESEWLFKFSDKGCHVTMCGEETSLEKVEKKDRKPNVKTIIDTECSIVKATKNDAFDSDKLEKSISEMDAIVVKTGESKYILLRDGKNYFISGYNVTLPRNYDFLHSITRENSSKLNSDISVENLLAKAKETSKKYLKESAEILDEIVADTKNYGKDRVAIISSYYIKSSSNPYRYKLLSLYEKKGSHVEPLLSNFRLSYTQSDNNQERENYYSATHKYKLKNTSDVSRLEFEHTYVFEHEQSHKKLIVKKWSVKLDPKVFVFKNGKYEAIKQKKKPLFNLDEVLKNAQKGLRYKKIVLEAMLFEVPVSKENVKRYAQIGQALKKFKYLKEAEFLLGSIFKSKYVNSFALEVLANIFYENSLLLQKKADELFKEGKINPSSVAMKANAEMIKALMLYRMEENLLKKEDDYMGKVIYVRFEEAEHFVMDNEDVIEFIKTGIYADATVYDYLDDELQEDMRLMDARDLSFKDEI